MSWEVRRGRTAAASPAFSPTPSPQHVTCGARNDHEVLPRRPVGDVATVERDQLVDGPRRRSLELPHARQAWPMLVALAPDPGYKPVLLRDERARTDQAHLPGDDVEQLRQLVEMGAAQC